ncbi:MAG: trypsin-like peptidase domain-containing protein [Patescibacteria group bacterium]
MKISMPEGIRSSIKHWIFYHNSFILAVMLLVIAAGIWFRDPLISRIVVEKIVTEEETIIEVTEATEPAVVSIAVESSNVLTGRQELSGRGTGFVVRENGLILTNRHVVEDGEDYVVIAADGTQYAVSKIEIDTFLDFAIVKIEASGLPTLTLGDSDQIRLGQTVVAIGNALGEFTNSVTRGVISGIGRGITVGQESLENVIQTDAAINPGNSGGPLLNLAGEVIGINTAIARDSENIGFAIPINLVKPVFEQYEQTGKISRPFLGVGYTLLSEEEAAFYEIPVGAYVTEVSKNSGAAKAGVKVGDIITAINGEAVSPSNGLAKLIIKYQIGDKVTLTIDREGKAVTLKATLSESF